MIRGSIHSKDNTAQLAKLLKKVAQSEVYVGIPEEKAPRKGSGEISNAQLCYIHTHGSPLRGIPARPIIEPAIEAEDNKEAIARELGRAVESVLDGKPELARSALQRAGLEGQNRARAWFEDPRNEWTPNSSRTIAMKGSDSPLIDTGELRKSIIYVVKDEK